MPLLAVALIAGGGLAYEVLLMRLYAIAQWHHFAFMVISIALLGFGLSGTALALARRWALARFDGLWQANAAGFGLAALAGFALAQLLPVNPMELAWQPRLFGRVALVYLLLMLPFFCAANCIGLAFARFGAEAGRIYRFDLVGSGLGAAAVVGALFLVEPQAALRAMPAVGFAAAAVVTWGPGRGARARAGALVLAGLAAAALAPAGWLAPRVSQYKGLARALDLPGAEVVLRRPSPVGRLDVVESPERPLRHAPGLSLRSPVAPPEQLGLFVDAGGPLAIARYAGDREVLAYLDYTTRAAPYHLLERPAVLVFGLGGGAEILLADRYHDAARVEAVELHPGIVELLRADLAAYAGDLLAPGHVRARVAEARAFLAATEQRYDLIQVPVLESFGAAAAGLGGLQETYAYTVEAFAEALAHLRPGGLLAVSRWLKVPPRDSLKAAATAIAALERLGVAEPAERLAVVRGWKTTTLMVKRGRFEAADVAALKAFAAERGFDLAYYPGMARAEANRRNVLDAPYVYDGVSRLLGPGRADLMARYKFDLRPATDDRPYFFDFAKWTSLPELLALRARGAMPLVEWGMIVLAATLVQAAVLSAALVLGPLAVLRGRAAATGGRGAVAATFLALGLAFLFVEIVLIKRLTLFLGHPLYAVAVVLAAFLVFAGLGAGTAPRLAARLAGSRATPVDAAAAAIVALGIVYIVAGPGLLEAAIGLAPPLKVALALAGMAPMAFAMGMPFPLAVARLAERAPALVPWAWGINGCASVVSAVLAALLAIEVGFATVLALALALYGVAAVGYRHLP